MDVRRQVVRTTANSDQICRSHRPNGFGEDVCFSMLLTPKPPPFDTRITIYLSIVFEESHSKLLVFNEVKEMRHPRYSPDSLVSHCQLYESRSDEIGILAHLKSRRRLCHASWDLAR